MRCILCGWIVREEHCPCGATARDAGALVPVGAQVLARAGRGPSMQRWDRGEVEGHIGQVHRVSTSCGVHWCEADDILPDAAKRTELLVAGTRVWALWLDGRWYPGTVGAVQGHLRRICWDDGDAMWMEARDVVVLAVPAASLQAGSRVQVWRWDGRRAWATVEETEETRCRVSFGEGEEEWVAASDVQGIPPNPFADSVE